MTQTIMTQQEKPKSIDKKALKKAAKRNLVDAGVSVEKTNGADKRREQDIADLRQMIGEATTPEEARNIYNQLGKDLIPKDKFQELIERFETETSKHPVEAKPAPTATAEEPPQKTLGEELKAAIEETAKATPEEIEASLPQTGQTEEKEEPAPRVRVKVEGREYPVQAYEEAPEDEATILLRKVLNEEVAKLDQQLQNPALEQFHGQIFHQIETLRKIESGYDPRHELDQALANEEISQESYAKIVAEIEPKEKPATETGRWKRYIQDNMRRLQAERTRERGQRKRDQQEEDRTSAKAHRKQKREKYLEAHPEEREYLEARDILEEETFEPTPEMAAISGEIQQALSDATTQWQKVKSYNMLNAKVLADLLVLQLAFRKVEFLRHSLKVATVQAKTEWEEKRELAKKLLHRGQEESHFGSIRIEGKLPEVTFGDKLKKALENPITEEIKKPAVLHKPKKAVKQEATPTAEERPLSVLLKSLRSDMIRGKISPDTFLQTMGKIRELKQRLIRGKITPQQFKQEIQKL